MNIIITSGQLSEKIENFELSTTNQTKNVALDLLSDLTKYKINKPYNKLNKTIYRILSDEDKIFFIHTGDRKDLPLNSDLVEYIFVDNYSDLNKALTNTIEKNKIDILIHLMSVHKHDVQYSEKGLDFIDRPDILSNIKDLDKDIFLIATEARTTDWSYEDEEIKPILDNSYNMIEKINIDLLISMCLNNILDGFIPTRYFNTMYRGYARYAYSTEKEEEISETIVNLILHLKSEPFYMQIPTDYNELGYYDGTLDGTFTKNNKEYYFHWTNDLFIKHARIYTVLELNKEEIKQFKYYEDLSEKYYSTKETIMEKEPGYWERVRKLLETDNFSEFLEKLKDKNNMVALAIDDFY
jgi:hypothetical protein